METPGQELKKIIPPEIEVKLESIDEVLEVRLCTLADDIWADNKFGRPIENVLLKPTLKELIQIFFRLLKPKSQEHFTLRKVTFIDDEGQKLEQSIGGADLLVWSIKGGNEMVEISKAILKSIGYSRPIIEEAEAQLLKKKSNHQTQSQRTDGKESSTFSHTSTDGRQNTSSAALSGKSHGESKASTSATAAG